MQYGNLSKKPGFDKKPGSLFRFTLFDDIEVDTPDENPGESHRDQSLRVDLGTGEMRIQIEDIAVFDQ